MKNINLCGNFNQIKPEVKSISKKENKQTFVIEPLMPGYGITLGNSLRRVLLSSLEGAAVTSVKIKGIKHEFSTIPGVKEDVIEIILNLKKLIFKVHSNEPQVLKLKEKGPKKVTAKDIKLTSEVEVVDPNLPIATLDNKKSDLEMEIIVEKGIGYLATEDRKDKSLPIGVIAVDACFTPVRKVSFEVENTRVGEIINLDKLILTIITNGVVSPEEALKKAAEILIQQFNYILEKPKPEKKEKRVIPVKEKPEDILVEEIDLNDRTRNVLLKHKVKSVKDILELNIEGLKKIKGLGVTSLNEIKQKLNQLGYSLEENNDK